MQFAQINYLQLKQLEYNGNWPQNVRKSLKIKQSRNFVEYLVESLGLKGLTGEVRIEDCKDKSSISCRAQVNYQREQHSGRKKQ